MDFLNQEIKKVRYATEGWYSSPGMLPSPYILANVDYFFFSSGVDTETEKGHRVRVSGREMTFPFQLTTLKKRKNSLGKFQDPPHAHNESEETLQDYFIRECQGIRDSQLKVVDTHYTPLMDTRKPDFVFIQKERPLDPLNVVAIGEIRKRSSPKFQNADVGHAVTFGEKVLQLQPRRSHVYVVLTDCEIIIIYKVTRSSCSTHRFSYEFTAPEYLKYAGSDPPTGWRYLVTILESSPEQLGWIEPSLTFDNETVTLVRSINTGRTSVVYEGILSNESVVVKIAKKEEYFTCFTREKEVLLKLSELKSPHIPRLLLSSEDILVMSPVCTKVNSLTKDDIRNIIKTLKEVHSQFHIIHRDLRKFNFLRDDNGNILLADWGYSIFDYEQAEFAGALECMPNNILTSLVNNESITYGPEIDLVCLVRSLYLVFHRPAMKRISFGKESDFKRRLHDILDFWTNNGSSELWARIHQAAEKLEYDDLLRLLEELF
jgi:predicted Ser/Thr protein kinase